MFLKSSPKVLAGTAVLAMAVLGLSACSSGNTDSESSEASGKCGTVPNIAPIDPNGVLAGFNAEVVDSFNGYPFTVQESAWMDWKSEKTSGFTAALVGQAPAAPFIATMNESIRTSLVKEGFEVVADFAPDDPTNVPLQIQQFQQALALKPDVIIFTAGAPEPAIDLVKAAYDAGIPVVGAQVPIDSPYAVSVVPNQVQQAMISGAASLGAIGGTGNVLRVNGIPGIQPQLDAKAGFDAVLALCPNVKVAGEVTGLFQPPTAQAETIKFLSTNPAPIDAVLQDGTMGLGIANAFNEVGQELPVIGDVGASQGFASYGLQNPEYPYNGTTQPAARTGEVSVQVAKMILEGAGPKLNQIVWNPFLMDQKNLSEYAEDSWPLESFAAVEGPADSFLPDSILNQYFTKP